MGMCVCVCMCVCTCTCVCSCVFVSLIFIIEIRIFGCSFVGKHKVRMWNNWFVKWLVDLNCVCEVLSEFITYFWVGA